MRGAEHRRPTVQVQPVRVARIHALGEVRVEERRQACVRDARRKAVDEHPVAPRHASLRDRLVQARDRAGLRDLERLEIRAREPARKVESRVAIRGPEAAGRTTPPRGAGPRASRSHERDSMLRAAPTPERSTPGAPCAGASSITSRGVRSTEPEAVPVPATAATTTAKNARRRTGELLANPARVAPATPSGLRRRRSRCRGSSCPWRSPGCSTCRRPLHPAYAGAAP